MDGLLSTGTSGSNGEINEGSRVEFDSNIVEGLVGHWKLNSEYVTDTTEFLDLSGNPNTGSSANTPVFTSDQNDVSGQAMVFNGSSDYITTTADDTLRETTYSFWAKSDYTSDYNVIFNHGDYPKGIFSFNWESKPLLVLGASNYRYWDDTSAQDDGEWHHWVVYVAGSAQNDIRNSKLYVDSIEQAISSTIDSEAIDAYTTGLILGKRGSDYFDGSLSDVKIYNRALTPEEIKQQYLSGLKNLPFENQFQNKSALVDNTNNNPEYWRTQLTSQSGYTDDSNWLMSGSTRDVALNINNIYTYGTEDLWRKIFLEQNYSGTTIESYENLMTYNTNRTNTQIATVLGFLDNTDTSSSVAEWLNRKAANIIYEYNTNYGLLYDGSNVTSIMDISLEKSSSATDRYNWLDLVSSGTITSGSSGLIFSGSNNTLTSNELSVDNIDFYNNNWTFYCKHTPTKYTSSEAGLLYFTGSESQTGLYLSIGEFSTSPSDELKLTVVSGSNDTGSVNWMYCSNSSDVENIIVATYDSSSYLLTLNNYFDSTWHSSSMTVYNTSYPFPTGSDDSEYYSGSIKNIRLYNSIEDRDAVIEWN